MNVNLDTLLTNAHPDTAAVPNNLTAELIVILGGMLSLLDETRLWADDEAWTGETTEDIDQLERIITKCGKKISKVEEPSFRVSLDVTMKELDAATEGSE